MLPAMLLDGRISMSRERFSVAHPKGLRVCCPRKPEWGLGHVLADDGGARVTVFFLAGEKRTLDTTSTELKLVTGPVAGNPTLPEIGTGHQLGDNPLIFRGREFTSWAGVAEGWSATV